MIASNAIVMSIEYNLTRLCCLGLSFLREDDFTDPFRPASVINRLNHPSVETSCPIPPQSEKDC